MWHNFWKQNVYLPLILSHIWHLKTQRQTINSHQGYGDFHQRRRKSWLFFDGHSLWTVKKTTTAIIRFSHKKSDIRKVFSSTKACSQQSTVSCFYVCSVWEPSFGKGFLKSADPLALFSWDLQEVMSCVFWIQSQCYVSNAMLVLVLCSCCSLTPAELPGRRHHIPLTPMPPLSASKPKVLVFGLQPLCSPLLWCL